MSVGGCAVRKRRPEVYILMVGGDGVGSIRRLQRRTVRKFAQYYGFEEIFESTGVDWVDASLPTLRAHIFAEAMKR